MIELAVLTLAAFATLAVLGLVFGLLHVAFEIVMIPLALIGGLLAVVLKVIAAVVVIAVLVALAPVILGVLAVLAVVLVPIGLMVGAMCLGFGALGLVF